MANLEKRVEALESAAGQSDGGGCIPLVLIHPGEDGDEKAARCVAQYTARHGKAPARVTCVTFVKPPHRGEDDDDAR
ncbi:MAG: hypothetical protein QM586_11990 [Xenophilus sp.]